MKRAELFAFQKKVSYTVNGIGVLLLPLQILFFRPCFRLKAQLYQILINQ
jgi:hypothetical protein